MGAHIVDGEFQSDKYPTTPRGKVPLSVNDPTAQDLLWEYAQRRRAVDAEFSEDLEAALRAAGFEETDLERRGDPPIDIVIFSEGDFDHVTEQSSESQAAAFALGISEGAGLYGAGSCSAYVMPGDTEEMRKNENAEQVRRALAGLDKHRAARERDRAAPPAEM